MMTPSPFIPRGSLTTTRSSQERSIARVAVFGILAVHLVFLGLLLIQGCRHDGYQEENPGFPPTNASPPTEANVPVGMASNPETNLPAGPPPVAPPTSTQPILEPPGPLTAARNYTVVKGDSFYKIAKVNHVSLSALIQANSGAAASRLQVGTVLQIPPAAEAASITAPAPAPLGTATAEAGMAPPGNFQAVYVVKTGDNLIKIAKAHGTTVKALKAANGLKGDRIVPGKKLRIPVAGAPSGVPRTNPPRSLPPR